MVSVMKTMILMALLVMCVRGKTVEQCKKTTCKTQCKDVDSFVCADCLVKCAFPGSANKIDQRALCLQNCNVGCGPDNDCYKRCIKQCS
ncbi:unnamed protein product [Cochlearia groenlandica]